MRGFGGWVDTAKIVGSLLVLLWAFCFGYKMAADKAELKRLKDLEAAQVIYDHRLNLAFQKQGELTIQLDQVRARKQQLTQEVQALVSDQTDRDCAPTVRIVRVLNDARTDGLPAPAREPVEADTTASDVGFRDLIHDNVEVASSYQVARHQCNALIDWVRSNYSPAP